MKKISGRGSLMALAALAVSAESLWAHPGHGLGATLHDVAHWLSSPDHAASVLGIAIAVVVLGAWALRSRGQPNG